MWESEFQRYKNMDSIEKKEFLISIADTEQFVDLYSKWSHIDSDGNRPNFTCGYTNQIFSAVPDNRISLPDPLQIKGIERSLKRSLTPEELSGEADIVINGKVIQLKAVVFPDDF